MSISIIRVLGLHIKFLIINSILTNTNITFTNKFSPSKYTIIRSIPTIIHSIYHAIYYLISTVYPNIIKIIIARIISIIISKCSSKSWVWCSNTIYFLSNSTSNMNSTYVSILRSRNNIGSNFTTITIIDSGPKRLIKYLINLCRSITRVIK